AAARAAIRGCGGGPVSVRSMTGFARVRRTIEQGEIVASLKSVNHRGLDLHFHLPTELDPLEHEIRALIKSKMVRGHVQIHISFARTGGAAASLNRELFEVYLQAFREASSRFEIKGQPDLNAALRIPGMLGSGTDEELSETVGQAILQVVQEAI